MLIDTFLSLSGIKSFLGTIFSENNYSIYFVSFLFYCFYLKSVLQTTWVTFLFTSPSNHAVAWEAWQASLRSQKKAVFRPLHNPRGPEDLTLQHSCGSHSHSEVPGLSPEGLLGMRAWRHKKQREARSWSGRGCNGS